MTPVIVRDEPGATPTDLDSYRPHMMRLVRCLACEQKHLVVQRRGVEFQPEYPCVICGAGACRALSPLCLPVPMAKGETVYDTLRAMGMRMIE